LNIPAHFRNAVDCSNLIDSAWHTSFRRISSLIFTYPGDVLREKLTGGNG
jgi:hypothetical protein